MALGYPYLNARAKGLKARLLGNESLRRLCQVRDMEELVLRLADEPRYGRRLREEFGEAMSPRRIEAGLEAELSAVFESFWRDSRPEIRRWLELWLAPWDLANLKILLRGWASGAAAEALTSRWAVRGVLSENELEELAAASSVSELARRLAPRSPLFTEIARVLRTWEDAPRVEAEETVDRAWAACVAAEVGRDGEDGATLGNFLAPEMEARNLLVALKLARDGGARHVVLLAGGRAATERLARNVAEQPSLERGLDALEGSAFASIAEAEALPFEAERALERIERRLRAYVLRAGGRVYAGSDPLGVGVLVRFLQLKANEVVNLRAIVRGLEQRLPGGVTERRLVLV